MHCRPISAAGHLWAPYGYLEYVGKCVLGMQRFRKDADRWEQAGDTFPFHYKSQMTKLWNGDFLQGCAVLPDDTILVMPACPDQAARMKTILEDYAASVRLIINFHKSTLIPINIDQRYAMELAHVFGCSVGSLPFTYLGLPMGTTKPTLLDLMPLVHGVERKMSTALALMSSGAKLTLVNFAVTSMLIYAMCMLKLHPKVIEHLDKLCRSFLWVKKTDDGLKGNSLAAWDLVCRPKHRGDWR